MSKLVFHFICIIILIITTVESKAQTWDWVKTYGTTMMDEGQSIGVDRWGNVYVKGRSDYATGGPNGGLTIIRRLFKYGPAGNLLWMDTLSVQGNLAKTDKNGNTFIVSAGVINKLDSSGAVVWSKTIANRYFEKIALTPNGGIVVSGKVQGIDYQNCSSEIYMLDANGNQVWNRSGDAPSCSPIVACDKLGTTYAMCQLDNNGTYSTKLLKINAAGVLSGTLAMPQFTFLPWGSSITVSEDLSIYAWATLSNYGSYTTTVAKYNQLGNTLWENFFTYNSSGSSVSDMATDSVNNLYFVTTMWGNVKYQTTTFTGSVSLLILKVDPTGNILWSKQTSGNNNLVASSLAIFNNEVYLTGIIQGTHQFDNLSVTGGTPRDMFVAKLNPPTATSLKDEKKTEQTFALYPNPTNGTITIQSEKEIKNGELRIENVLGQLVYLQKIGSSDSLNVMIDLTQYPKGVYFVQFKSVETIEIRKIVLE